MEFKNRRDTGYTQINYKNGDYTGLSFEAYDEFIRVFQKGEAFYNGVAFHGAKVCIKLGDIITVIQHTPEQIKHTNEEVLAHKNQDSIMGID